MSKNSEKENIVETIEILRDTYLKLGFQLTPDGEKLLDEGLNKKLTVPDLICYIFVQVYARHAKEGLSDFKKAEHVQKSGAIFREHIHYLREIGAFSEHMSERHLMSLFAVTEIDRQQEYFINNIISHGKDKVFLVPLEGNIFKL